ncbi:MAG: elongation factor P [Spirochaetales bacterium]|jgi:elongation factor P|nr:elongation factor P [Spirochaetales bacterium]MCR5442183.1 elongation factor P [Sphaerochaetaceae bacterium]MBQ3317734.1 elongation factor P [Spirochaetales bacterium]MBQ3697789.1 elongation factor P [Spirochaetales bacterium]MBQ3729221.1 elongation factor P [Spirochaetales bacterium]
MIKAGQIDKGTALLIKGAPFICVEREFVNPGKGSAFVRLKLKSPTTGQVLQETIKSQDTVEDINVEMMDYQYMYNDGENFHMMNVDTYDQFEVPMANFEGYELLMKDGETYRCTVYNDEILDIQIPSKVVYLVAEAEEAIKGDTVQGATKFVTTETGLRVRVPIFIKQGEKIRVNTETKEYLERVNG